MARRVARALDEGAFGLSSGLEYDPGFQASPAEIAALAREAAGHRSTPPTSAARATACWTRWRRRWTWGGARGSPSTSPT